MISLDTSALGVINPQHGLSPAELSSVADKVSPFLAKIKSRNQGFFYDEILNDTKLVDDILTFTDSAKGQYDSIVILGIGGSALGPIALREAFGNLFSGTSPELVVLDNIDPDFLAEATEYLDFSRTLFLVVSKSGGTPETVSQYFYFQDQLIKAGLDQKKHFVFITDPEKSFLLEQSKELGIRTFPIPPNVGGRFSVLTSVGLVPAALMGIDIKQMLEGARNMRDLFLNEDAMMNPAFVLASIQYLLMQKGKSQNILYPYSQKLFRIADWCRQLIAESTGKRHSEDGAEINTGITPIAALGATDQHSQNQLYFEGPNDKLFIFFEVENFTHHLDIPLPSDASEKLDYLKNTDFGTLLNLEKAGTGGALSQVDRPHITVKITRVDEAAIGEIFLLFEGATAFLCEFLNINAFDQPGVELSKNITKELLLKR